jgi:hypothetical protein
MKPCLRLCLLLILVLGAPPVHATPTIGIYTDFFGVRCADTTMDGVLQGSVWANGVDGITGAEFGVYCSKYWTNNLLLTFTAERGSIQLGDPMCCKEWATGGTSLAFTSCQEGSRVRLLTFLLFEKTPTEDIAFHITAKDRPANPYFRCPLITLCDAPAYTKQCVGIGQEAIINPSSAVRCPLTSGSDRGSPQIANVHPATWSAMKNIYR